MTSFRRADDGEIRALFTTQELQVLTNLTEQLLELLGESELHTAAPGEGVDPFMNLMGISTSEAPPEDPVLRRLLPNAYKDQEAAAEFRRYTEHGLREKKRAHALLIHEVILTSQEEFLERAESTGIAPWSGEQIPDRAALELAIRDDDVSAWLGGLNDLRIALAVRLGIGGLDDQIGDEDVKSKSASLELLNESDPMKPVYAVYSWLGWLQQSLLEVIMTSGDDHQAS